MNQPSTLLLSGAEFKAESLSNLSVATRRGAGLLPHHHEGRTPARMWFLTRYADVATLREDQRFIKDAQATLSAEERRNQPAAPPLYQLLTRHMLNTERRRSRPLRLVDTKPFTSTRQVELLEGPRLVAIAHRLLDRVVAHGEMDYIEEFALPFSIAVIANCWASPAATITASRLVAHFDGALHRRRPQRAQNRTPGAGDARFRLVPGSHLCRTAAAHHSPT